MVEVTHTHEWPGNYTYCPRCGTGLEMRTQGGKLRPSCPSCPFVQFRNPGVGAAVVVLDGSGHILMVKRAEGATRSGYWSVPAGFVDYGEDVREAARRELFEETGLVAEIGEVLHVASNFHDPSKLTIGIWFAGAVTGGDLKAGDDAEEADFFPIDALPPLAFETDREFLRGLG